MLRYVRRTLLLVFALSSVTVLAQEAMPLPAIVQRSIDDDTLVVARIDLTKPSTATIGRFLADLPDPTGTLGIRSANCERALKTLVELKVKDVFVIVSTIHLPINGAMIVVPFAGSEKERNSVAEGLKSVWPKHVELVSDGVIVGGRTVDAPRLTAKPNLRLEFSIALTSVKQAQMQIAFSLGTDARRVLREAMPQLPLEFGGGAIDPVSDCWQWMAIGLTPSDRPELSVLFQASDDVSADRLQEFLASRVKFLTENRDAEKVFPNLPALAPFLTPTRKENQLIFSLTDSNGGAATLKEKLEIPLLADLEKMNQRARSKNALKQVMLAMHNYHDDKHKSFPAQAIRSKDDKKLLSWRVALLPYLGEKALYNEFHLDEPWDSPHNMKLVGRIPEVYALGNITRAQMKQGLTTFLGLVADKTVFGTPEAVSIQMISDGTSNTIAVVDANSDRAVPWTKPEDLDVDLKLPFKGLSGQAGGQFRAAMCDGAVRDISILIAPETLRRLFQINDGEDVGDF